ncbi:phosphopantetheine-binding protein [Bacillus paranthracis]|uniref:acyl carrier protein n=1 Tax=Bacillus TaxID=1386 RepID=UPI000200F1D9|nr:MULTISPECIES: phosphopantetheine-binding protein [Bacillus]ADY24326.1 putative acyl-carrier protein [Bacillus thuringiensis serovar finitimus YBT-020]MCW4575073.1 phosphopantetheine-binding protein [Bacillus pacificus]MDA1585488.1 phosphopantetheine-binding protein [Bacillus cereus group sp. TH230-1LC]MRC74811.1 acyl carrier protein [Bacillus thuringiensis]OTX78280.1 acyl carrier protein [Bacillus thuringiensis serovar finitimus]
MIKLQIKEKLVEMYKMSINPAEINNEIPLFGKDSPYGLDSMDVLIFINVLKKDYELNIGAVDMNVFRTINSIVKYIEEQKGTSVIE